MLVGMNVHAPWVGGKLHELLVSGTVPVDDLDGMTCIGRTPAAHGGYCLDQSSVVLFLGRSRLP